MGAEWRIGGRFRYSKQTKKSVLAKMVLVSERSALREAWKNVFFPPSYPLFRFIVTKATKIIAL
jgi:hypothetical protein